MTTDWGTDVSGSYLIWSAERGQWWRGSKGANGPVFGYTSELTEAGTFSFERASEICDQANRDVPAGKPLEEVMFALPPFPMGTFRK